MAVRLQLEIVECVPAARAGRRFGAVAGGFVEVAAADRAEAGAVVRAEQRHREFQQHFGADLFGNIHLILISEFQKQTDGIVFDVSGDRFQTAAADAGEFRADPALDQRAAGNGIPATPHTKRVIDENSIPVPVRPAARPAAAVQRTAETTRTAAEPVRRTAAPAAPVTRADLAAQNEATVRTVARPAAARPAAPKAAPTAAAPAPVRETPKAAPAPVKEAPKAASAEEFDLDSILAEFK